MEEASAFGVMSVYEHSRVVRFQEKPQNPDPIPGRGRSPSGVHGDLCLQHEQQLIKTPRV